METESFWRFPGLWQTGVLILMLLVALAEPVRELWESPDYKKERWLWLLVILLSLLHPGLFFLAGQERAEQQNAQAKSEARSDAANRQLERAGKELESLRAVVERIGARDGDEGLLELLLAREYELRAEVSRAEAEDFARRIAADLPKVPDRVRATEGANRRAAADTLLRWGSFYNAILGQFDGTIDALQSKGIPVETTISEEGLILATERRTERNFTVRVVQFKGSVVANVDVAGGLFENGVLTEGAQMIFGNGEQRVFTVAFNAESFSVSNSNPAIFSEFESYGAESDPATDPEYLHRIKAAINEALASGILNAEAAAAEKIEALSEGEAGSR